MTTVEAVGPASYTLIHRGHRFELTAGRGPKGTLYRLTLDRRQVAEHETTWRDPRFVLAELDLGVDPAALGLEGGRIVATSWRRGRISSCNLVLPADALKRETAAGESDDDDGDGLGKPEKIPFEPPPGTRAHRAYVFKRDRPQLYAARHLVVAVGEVVVALLGIRIAIDLIPPWDKLPFPDINLPSVDLPGIPWPDINWPDINWPDIDWPGLPGWLTAILTHKQFWLPILIAVFAALGELERRKKRQQREAEIAAEQQAAEAEPDDERVKETERS